jgi:hypothetical protein
MLAQRALVQHVTALDAEAETAALAGDAVACRLEVAQALDARA